MNLIKINIIFTILFLIGFNANADNHDKKLTEAVKKITQEIDLSEDDVPLNDPFAGQSAGSDRELESVEKEKDELSLYNFKLVGLISGKDNSYISLVQSNGERHSLTLGQYLGKNQLIDLRLTEAIFKKEDEKYIIIDFNNHIREANEY